MEKVAEKQDTKKLEKLLEGVCEIPKVKEEPYWFKVVREAKAAGGFTEGERNRARDWTTCACGRADPRIPRFNRGEILETPRGTWYPDMGMPRDKELAQLGSKFWDVVCANDFDGATTILEAIDKREGEVLKELGYDD